MLKFQKSGVDLLIIKTILMADMSASLFSIEVKKPTPLENSGKNLSIVIESVAYYHIVQSKWFFSVIVSQKSGEEERI